MNWFLSKDIFQVLEGGISEALASNTFFFLEDRVAIIFFFFLFPTIIHSSWWTRDLDGSGTSFVGSTGWTRLNERGLHEEPRRARSWAVDLEDEASIIGVREGN